MNGNYTKWVSCWGNASSIIDQKECRFSKNLTLRYPVRMCFDGDRLRFRFSNLTGKETVSITKAGIAKAGAGSDLIPGTFRYLTFGGEQSARINPGEEILSDEVDFPVDAGELIAVSMYLRDYTDMNAGVLITGPLSKGYYAYGDFADSETLPSALTRNTNWFYFLNTIDVRTEEKNQALVCYGDSITAQSWPDDLTLLLNEKNVRDTAVIRRAVSGTRILREYDCITYAAYGLKGEKRFKREISTVSGASAVLIQHGINDIIHPVGTDINIFRPWSDLPTAAELADGVEKLYVIPAREMGLMVFSGTLLPIYGWRTYADFREKLKNEFNEFLRTSAVFDDCVDFDLALRDPENPERFREGFDSGDHLHPSEAAYRKMAEAAFGTIFSGKANTAL